MADAADPALALPRLGMAAIDAPHARQADARTHLEAFWKIIQGHGAGSLRASDIFSNPVDAAGPQRFYDGLRKAGLPNRASGIIVVEAQPVGAPMSTSFSLASRAQWALVLVFAAASVHAEGRFTVSADGQEVTDTANQLTWRRCAEGMKFDAGKCSGKMARYDYRGAKQAAAAAAGSGSKSWHVPSREELLALVDKGRKKKPKIDTDAFPNTPATAFWASRAGSDDDLNAWLVSFNNGRVMANLGEKKFPLRLVRSAG